MRAKTISSMKFRRGTARAGAGGIGGGRDGIREARGLAAAVVGVAQQVFVRGFHPFVRRRRSGRAPGGPASRP